jgi:hypothetical protein
MGAEVEIVQLDTFEEAQPLLDPKAEALRAARRRPYIVAPCLDSWCSAGSAASPPRSNSTASSRRRGSSLMIWTLRAPT